MLQQGPVEILVGRGIWSGCLPVIVVDHESAARVTLGCLGDSRVFLMLLGLGL